MFGKWEWTSEEVSTGWDQFPFFSYQHPGGSCARAPLPHSWSSGLNGADLYLLWGWAPDRSGQSSRSGGRIISEVGMNPQPNRKRVSPEVLLGSGDTTTLFLKGSLSWKPVGLALPVAMFAPT